ncbi:MAG: DUF4214 domain-containing protein [Sterolibacterium sp.]
MAASDYYDVVQELYVGYFGRPADHYGLINMAASLEATGVAANIGAINSAYGTNTSVKDLVDSFGNSSESTTLYGSGTTATFVNAIFNQVLNRDALVAGLDFWVDAIDNGGLTRGKAALAIMEGALNNTSAQGLIDAAAVTNKITVATNFTAAQDTVDEIVSYSGATAAASARTMLLAVNDTTDTTAYQTTVDATLTSIVTAAAAAANPPQTFTLTTGVNSFTGGSGGDTFNAPYNSTSGMTFDSSDSLDGGAGTDTLNVGIGGTGTYQAASLANIENVVANFTAAGTLSLLGATGVSSVKIQGPTDNVIVTGVGSTSTGLTVTNTDKNITYSFASSAVSGSTDTASLTLSAVTGGTYTIASIETLNIASTGSANTITTLTAAAASNLVVTGDQTLTITNNLGVVATVDASAATGKVDLDFDTLGAVTVTGGSGNDVFSFETTAGAVSVTGNAGNDSFTFDNGATLTAADTVSGGDGTDTLVAYVANLDTTATATPYSKISGIETLKITDALANTVSTAGVQAGITTVTLNAGGTGTLTLEAGAQTVNISSSLTGGLTINDTGTATTDTLTITNSASAADDMGDGNALTIGGFETVTINGTGTGTATSQTFSTIAITADTGGSATLNLTGSNTFTTSGAITAKTINASGLTGTAVLTMSTAAASGLSTITGSAGGDTLLGDSSSSIDGGAGNDSIVGGSGADTLVGGDGLDTITSGAGNDTINAGAGNDSIIFGDNLTYLDSVDGGDGTDALSVTNASLTAINALSISSVTSLNAAISNVESVLVSDDLDQTSFDIARLDSISSISLVDWAGAEAIIGMVANSTVTLLDTGGDTNGTDDLTLTYADATGSADALTINLKNDATSNFGDVTIASIENLTIASSQVTADAATIRTHTFDLTATGLTTLTLTGTESFDISGVAVNATTITASGVTDTGASAPLVKLLGGSANQSITGSAGADTINAGAGADTIDGGAGADSITGGTGIDNITGGTGADTILGGSGNDVITLTESTAAVDDVVLDYSEAGLYVDTVTGFTTGSSGDEIQLSMGGLELAGTSGIHSATTNFQALNANTDAAAGAGTVQVMTTAAASAGAANIFVLSGATFADVSEVEDGLETGGSYQIGVSVTDADLAAADAFIVVYTDGVNAYVASARIVTDPSTNGVFAAGGLDVNNLVTLAGVTTIGSSTFAAANFEWIA